MRVSQSFLIIFTICIFMAILCGCTDISINSDEKNWESNNNVDYEQSCNDRTEVIEDINSCARDKYFSSGELIDFSDDESNLINDIISGNFKNTIQKTTMSMLGTSILENYSRRALENDSQYYWALADANNDGFDDLILTTEYDILWKQWVVIAAYDIKDEGNCLYFDDTDMTSYNFLTDKGTIVSCLVNNNSMNLIENGNALSLWRVDIYTEEDYFKWDDWAQYYNVDLVKGHNVYFTLEPDNKYNPEFDEYYNIINEDNTYKFISRELFAEEFKKMTGVDSEVINEWLE